MAKRGYADENGEYHEPMSKREADASMRDMKNFVDIMKPCKKCGKPMEGRGMTLPAFPNDKNYYVFCANVESGCYKGW